MAPKDFSHVEPKPAATVLLVRDSGDGIEVFMVVRHHKIDFASGAMVFPGGKVDEADRDLGLRSRCRHGDALSEVALATRIAAVRETFEECGILLARPAGEEALIDSARLEELKPWALRIHSGEASLAEFVETENLELALDRLNHFAHWTTPPVMPKRFNTHFYLVGVPQGQLAIHDGHESVDSRWITPKDAIELTDAGQATLVFATRLNLTKLGWSRTVVDATRTARAAKVVEVMPQMVSMEEGMRKLRIPEAAGYGGEVFDVKDQPAMKVG